VDEFKEILNQIRDHSFDLYSSALRARIKHSRNDRKLLKRSLQEILKTTWHHIFPILKKNNYCIYTGVSGSKLPRSARNTIPKLAKNKILFKKVDRGIYEVDWESLPHTGKRYFTLKENERSMKRQREARKKISIHKKTQVTRRTPWSEIKC
jgi:hypothetical protein